MTSTDTIVAPSTPCGFGGLAVVRLSGSNALSIAESLSRSKNTKSNLKNRLATNKTIFDKDGRLLDDVIITYFKGPKSYTGEDVIEISCHGSPSIVSSIISLSVSYGARLAEAGEFTRRAFLAGKLDLIQAESVASLIHSRSTHSAKLNANMVRGALSNKLLESRKKLITALSLIEFELDVSEDEIDTSRINHCHSILQSVCKSFYTLLGTYHDGRIISSGARVAIIGEPNVGKSTLLNALLRKKRAITSEIPGTTRDTIEAYSVIGGLSVCFVDTAGIRDAEDLIEKDGVDRSHQEITSSDLVIHVMDKTSYPIVNYGVTTLFVLNKSDIIDKNALQPFVDIHNDVVAVSAKEELNIDGLEKAISSKLLDKTIFSSDVYLTTERQKSTIYDTHNKLEKLLENWDIASESLETVAFDIGEITKQLESLLGATSVDDVLNKMFVNFCVGK